MATPPKKKTQPKKVYWHERPPGSSLKLRDEFRARGFNSMLALRSAKKTFKRQMIPTLKKIAKKLERNDGDLSIMRNLYSHVTDRNRKPNSPMGFVVGTWMMRYQSETQMDQYMRGWIPDDAIPILRAANISGERARTLQQYIWIAEKKKQRANTIKAGMMAPLINGAVMIIYLLVIAKFIVPNYAQAVDQKYWKGALLITKYIAMAINDYIVPIGIFLAISSAIIIYSMPNYTGKYRLALEKYSPIPFWGAYKQMIGANFLMSFSALNDAAIPEDEIVGILMRDAPKYYLSRLKAIKSFTSEGERITDALDDCGLEFPDKSIIIDLLSYQDTDDFSKEMAYIAREWVDSSIAKIKTAITGVDMVITIVCYALLGLITSADLQFVKLVRDHMGH